MISKYKKVPKSMPKKEVGLLLQTLREIRRVSTMNTANFSEEIKEETRLWRTTWIIEPLDEIIERYENFLGE